ncbi:MAG: putative flippase GtrA [Cryomorphaceae bacterium]
MSSIGPSQSQSSAFMLFKQFKLFIRSFSVSAFIGVSYIVILEIAQWQLGYDDGFSHSIVALIFYLLGIYVNYLMQKRLVFNATNTPWVSFVIYNISSAILVSALSGYLYTNQTLRSISLNYIESASTAIALLLISPITFIVFKKIFKHSV